jgi:uncharacterized membrane protein
VPSVIERKLETWIEAKVIESDVAERIRAFEEETSAHTGGRIAVQVAVALGSIALAAGVLLFVGAQWDQLSPAARFLLVLSMVAAFHAAGAVLAQRSHVYSVAMHALGTIALGAGVYLAGQIFNLDEHWPAGVMMWAAGAALAYWLLRDDVQGLFTALLVPTWLIAEWAVAAQPYRWSGAISEIVPMYGLVLTGSVCVTGYALRRTVIWRVLAGIGGLAAIVSACALIIEGGDRAFNPSGFPVSLAVIGFAVATAAPLAWAWLVDHDLLLPNLAMAAWAGIAILIARATYTAYTPYNYGARHIHDYLSFVWLLVAAAAIAWWGMQRDNKEVVQFGNFCAFIATAGILGFGHSALLPYLIAAAASAAWAGWGVWSGRLTNINTGVVMFAVAVAWFYFGELMNTMGRSAGLIGVGVLFLLGGWALAKARKELIAKVRMA